MVMVVREEEEHGLVRAIRRGRRMPDDPARTVDYRTYVV